MLARVLAARLGPAEHEILGHEEAHLLLARPGQQRLPIHFDQRAGIVERVRRIGIVVAAVDDLVGLLDVCAVELVRTRKRDRRQGDFGVIRKIDRCADELLAVQRDLRGLLVAAYNLGIDRRRTRVRGRTRFCSRRGLVDVRRLRVDLLAARACHGARHEQQRQAPSAAIANLAYQHVMVTHSITR